MKFSQTLMLSAGGFLTVLLLTIGYAAVEKEPVLATHSDTIKQIKSGSGEKIGYTDMIKDLAKRRVVFVGEQHTRMDHHLTQLTILKEMHARNPKIGIGVEWFQQGFQGVLDDFVLGKIDETEMLRRTEYYERWKFDYRLYRPIMNYARANQLPVIALNAPVEVTRKVSEKGLDGLSKEDRLKLPKEISPPTAEYKKQLDKVFAMHDLPKDQIERFITVQRVWDETMASNTVDFLQANPEAQMVVFSGIGHISHDAGIPRDFARLMPNETYARVMTENEKGDVPVIGEYILQSDEVLLPKKGMMGVWLETLEDHVKITRVSGEGAAAAAGIKAKDKIVSIDGGIIMNMTDLKLLMDRKKPKDSVQLVVIRGNEQKEFKVILK
ncbi:MAG: Unknown protein [uncultured Thiotrichaceae bacterium]|uniref:PDZ domain-containing protein n=1 Tax=uncultured Thiotrichaceae bacterium TaxID=298394 RepID=A0A6S6UFN4_9GAMM|nr:MAG: Unknown protein [uncultured Thiotrichaceae bacterium]